MTKSTLFRWCAALVVTAAFAVAIPPAASDEDPKSIADAKEARAEARERQLEAAMNLSIVDAADVEVAEALEAATELVNLQQAKVDASEQRLAAAARCAPAGRDRPRANAVS